MDLDAIRQSTRRSACAPARCLHACAALVLGAVVVSAGAQTLSEKARESGCVDKPKVVEGSTYRCSTSSGAAAYFNVPANASVSVPAPERSAPVRRPAAGPSPTPSATAFPRVDPETQRGRDDMRRKVLGDELAAEEKLLADSRAAYANGAPSPTAEEQADPQKYADRIARLRQAVQLHERNIEALKKELGAGR
jgi:hypothetical protein